MRYVISESPDYNRDYSWGPELHKVLDKELKTYGYITFFIDDEIGYIFIGPKPITGFKDTNSLYVAKFIDERLTDLFGDMWRPVMVKWFEDNTGWDVKNLNTYEQ